MTESAALSGLAHIGSRIFPGIASTRPEPLRLPEPQPTDASARRGTKADGALPKPLLSGETRLVSQAGAEELTEEEKEKVRDLQSRDREVRAHEQAHKAAGGSLAGQPTYQTMRGPDGRSYAVGGEVKIDTSTVPNNPEATIRKMEQVKRAALAPSNPSSADRQVAAEADTKIQQARQEKREQDSEERETTEGGGASAGPIGGTAKPGTAVNIVL